ncbi:MAG: hypothetical protein AAGN35_28310 [Bacteroidota bacterium]
MKILRVLLLLLVFGPALSAQSFTSLEEALEQPEAVVELDLSGQNLRRLDPRVASFRNLTTVNLDENAFAKFPAALLRLPKLEEISIAENRLTSVPQSLRKMKQLTFLDLRGNAIPEAKIRDIREVLEDVSEILTD